MTTATVTDVIGRTREIVGQIYADGSYSCPFCGAPVFPEQGCRWNGRPCGHGSTHCNNPVCPANPHLSPEWVAGRVAEAERLQAERDRSRRISESIAASANASSEAKAAKWAKVVAEADERGACLRCLRKSYWETSPKFVRHRSECPVERALKARDVR